MMRPRLGSFMVMLALVGAGSAVALPDGSVSASTRAGGNLLWAARYDNQGIDDRAQAVTVSPDGTRVFVTGYSPTSDWSDADYATLAYDAATGVNLWTRRYAGPAGGLDQANAIAVSPDGTMVFVTGASEGDGNDYLTVAYDALDGAELWQERYSGPGGGDKDDWPGAVVVSPDGSRVFVIGTSEGPSTTSDYATLAYDASTGRPLWIRRYTSRCPTCDDVATHGTLSPDGSTLFVTGASEGKSDPDFVTIAYDSVTGSTRWRVRTDFQSRNEFLAASIAVSPDGKKVFVTGDSEGDYTESAYATVGYEAATGAELWRALFSRSPHLRAFARAGAVSADGSLVFVTGSSDSSDGSDWVTLAYEAQTGARAWKSVYDRAVGESASAMGVSPEGAKVFVTGGTGGDYATVTYDSTSGSELWEARYDAFTGDDLAENLAVGPDGSKVFVTGYSESVNGEDYLTLAYEA